MTTLAPEIRRKIEERMDEIVQLAEATISHSKVYGRRCRNDHWTTEQTCPTCHERTQPVLQRSQLTNLQTFANATNSVKALELLVRYQMGRREGEGWRYSGDSDQQFGERVIGDFNTLERLAHEIAPSQKHEAHLWLIRLYTGYLARWFVALGGSEEEREVEKEGVQ